MFLYVLLGLVCLVLPPSSSEDLPGGILPQLANAPACGYHNLGRLFDVSSSIKVCLPPVFCNPETCPPQLGTCVNGQCQYIGSYKGLATYPKAIATYYCDLAIGGCQGALGGSILDMAKNAAKSLNIQLCSESSKGNCVGIAATSPMLMGNSQIAHTNASTFVPLWGLGLTYASGLCYELKREDRTVTVAMTDRCAGYCRCDGSRASDQGAYHECGEQQCYDYPTLHPNTPCIGSLPQIGYANCGGYGCDTVIQKCDWCASNSHAHFDLDLVAFNYLCGEDATSGSCQFSEVRPVPCDVGVEPPSPNSAGGGGSTPVPENAFDCSGESPSPQAPLIEGTKFCCHWGMIPISDMACDLPANASTTPNIESTTPKSESTTAKSRPTTPRSVSTTSKSKPTAPRSSPTSSKSEPTTQKIRPTTPKIGSTVSPGTVPTNAFYCGGVSPSRHTPLIPGTKYCCRWELVPISATACA